MTELYWEKGEPSIRNRTAVEVASDPCCTSGYGNYYGESRNLP